MLTTLSLLHGAANSTAKKMELPNPSLVVKALLEAEKNANKQTNSYTFDDLIGHWNLRFITGTKKTRSKAGIVLGAGKYVPKLVKIKISYDKNQEPTLNTGKVVNSVTIAFCNLSLTGPVKFIARKSILSFDFTTMTITIFGWKLYHGYIRGGAIKEAEFYQSKISKQAFFSYFLIDKNVIAARGRGGGLALWGRENSELL